MVTELRVGMITPRTPIQRMKFVTTAEARRVAQERGWIIGANIMLATKHSTPNVCTTMLLRTNVGKNDQGISLCAWEIQN